MRHNNTGFAVLLAAFLTAILIAAAAPNHLQAQSTTLIASIPFHFYVQAEKLPPGDYYVRRIGDAIQVSDREGHVAAVMTLPAAVQRMNSGGRLVFNVYEDSYFLSLVQWGEMGSARALVRSSLEAELARKAAAKQTDIAGVKR